MDQWNFHEAYKALDIKFIDGYPNKCPINQFDVLPKFDGNLLSVIAHIVDFTICIYYVNVLHEDVCLRLFLLSLGNEQRDWIKNSCKPRSIYSLTILIRQFLKHWGPEAQSLKDTIHDMEDVFSREDFDLDPIEVLRETLLLEFVETKIERQKVDKSNEESFECLKEIIEEDDEFCEQLIEIFPKRDFLVKFYQQREDECDSILNNYEEKPTLNSYWEVAIIYFGTKSLYEDVTEKYGYQENFPNDEEPLSIPKEVYKIIRDQD
jgi:hypothetical protein